MAAFLAFLWNTLVGAVVEYLGQSLVRAITV